MAIDIESESLLLDAVENDDFSNVKTLIKRGLNINDKLGDGSILLHQCFFSKKFELAQYLILLGANIRATDKYNRTPLHYAAKSGNYECAKLAILLGADLNAQDHKGRVPLMHAIKFKQLQVSKLLMTKGTDTDLQDNNGFSSLMWAIKHLDPEDLKKLLDPEQEDQLQKQVEEFEAASEDSNTLEVSDSIIENVLNSEKKEQEEIVLPNPLKEALKDKIDEEVIAPYSITEHIESLKKQAEEEGFDIYGYDTNERISEPGSEDQSSSSEFQDEKVTVTGADYEVYNQEKVTVTQEEIQAYEQEMLEVTRRDDSIESYSQESKKKASQASSGSYETEEIQKIEGATNEYKPEEVTRVTSTEQNHEQEVQEIKRSDNGHVEDDSTTRSFEQVEQSAEVKEQDQDNWKGEGGVEHIKEEIQRISGSESEDENWTTKSEGGHQESTSDYEITKLKRGESSQDEQHREVVSGKEGDNNQEEKTIVTTKKNINYERDGFKDEYKDKHGAIKKVDKRIGDDEHGEIVSENKQVGDDDYGEIKKTDKNIAADKEVQKREVVSGTPNEKEEAITVSGGTSHEAQERQKVKSKSEASNQPQDRAERPEIKPNILEQEEITRVKGSSAASEEESLDYSRNDKPKVEDEAGSISSTTENLTEESQSVKGEVTETKEDVTIVKEVQSNDDSDEDKLSVQEKEVIKNMADPNAKNKTGQTLCWIAASKGQTNLLKRIIKDGGDFEIKDTKGVSPLMIASINGHTEIIEYLAHKVRNVDEKRTDGATALTLAVENNQGDAIRVLLDNGASSETKIKGNTLLMHAASVGAINAMKILIMLGHDPLEKNFRGKTAIDAAKSARKKKSLAFLASVIKAKQKGS